MTDDDDAPTWTGATTATDADGQPRLACLGCGDWFEPESDREARAGLCRDCDRGLEAPESPDAVARAMMAVAWRIQNATACKDWWRLAMLLDYANRLADYEVEDAAPEYAPLSFERPLRGGCS